VQVLDFEEPAPKPPVSSGQTPSSQTANSETWVVGGQKKT
jgi:hypothetical protein